MERNSFVFYKEWMSAIGELPDSIRLEIYEGVIEYATTGKHKVLGPMASIAFNFIKATIDRDTEKYISIVERNKNNGCKGGRPKNPKEVKKPSGLFGNPEKPRKPDNDNDYDNDYNIRKIPKGIKRKDATDVAPPPLVSSQRFIQFQNWIVKNAPSVAKMQYPFTEEEMEKLYEDFPRELIQNIVLSMHNWKELNKKNTSANLTFRKWVDKEQKDLGKSKLERNLQLLKDE